MDFGSQVSSAFPSGPLNAPAEVLTLQVAKGVRRQTSELYDVRLAVKSMNLVVGCFCHCCFLRKVQICKTSALNCGRNCRLRVSMKRSTENTHQCKQLITPDVGAQWGEVCSVRPAGLCLRTTGRPL
eukprot:822026-Amphidinium_carterae.2